MSTISNIYSNYSAQASALYQKSTKNTNKADNTKNTSKTEETKASEKTSKSDYGKTIGKPSLSEKAAKYYETLKKKYNNLDFILVSEDEKENAKNNASSYANAAKTVVLIDEDKIERMATDESFRKKYEGIIAGASTGISSLKAKMEANGMSSAIKGFGAQVDDGGTLSYFAVVDKSLVAQKDRIAKKAAEKKAEKKAKEKAEDKKEAAEKLQEKKAEKASDASKSDSTSKVDSFSDEEDDGTMTVTASSWEELYSKLESMGLTNLPNSIVTPGEQLIGSGIDVKG